MKAKSVYHYFWFGTCVRYLQDAREGHPIHDEAGLVFNIDGFFKNVDELGLVVTRRAAAALDDYVKVVRALPADNTLTTKGASTLVQIMRDIRLTLEAELQGFDAYVVTPKSLDTNKLLSDVPALFAPDVFDVLPDLARYDFKEAARCIAFELPTAAAFHTLRGTEGVLRAYYRAFVRTKRISPLMWGPVVADLRKRAATRGQSTLLNNLDNIRVSFRNPTQHPELVYSISEAQDLWSLCVEVINRMTKYLRTASKTFA